MTTILATDLKADSLKAGVPTLHHLNVRLVFACNLCQQLMRYLELPIPESRMAPRRTRNRVQPRQIWAQRWSSSSIYGESPVRMPATFVDTRLMLSSPLGKAPTLVTKDNRVIIESPVIITYLISTYSPTGPFQAPDPLKSEEISSYAASTLGPVTSVELLIELLAKQTPWPISYITNAIRSKVQAYYTKGELVKAMRYLEGELGDEEWFNGKHVGKADFMCVFHLDMVAERGWIDFEKESPKIAAWRKRVWARPAWKKGLEKGGQYDMMALGWDSPGVWLIYSLIGEQWFCCESIRRCYRYTYFLRSRLVFNRFGGLSESCHLTSEFK